jgi:Fe-S-cluster containining protein
MAWMCTKCGACCRKAKDILGGLDVGFPYEFKEDGSCEMYDPAIGCTVYEDRPNICRMDLVAEETIKVMKITPQEYYHQATMSCNSMIDELNLDESFKIPEN